MQHWRTTVLGVLTILGTLTSAGIALLNGHQPDFATCSAGVLAGIGLIKAADSANVPPKP